MKTLNIIACVKKIPDPEAPPKAVNVDREQKKVSFTGVAPVINPFDENALEAALRLKEACGGHITVLSMDEKNARPVLSKVLAEGADRLIILDDEHFRDLDSLSVAYVLSRAILEIGEWDLIITGRQAGDWDSGQTGALIAELLQAPVVTLARSVLIEDGNIIVERVKPDGYERIRAKLPALITTSNEVGELRYTSVKQLVEARKMPCEFWSADDIEIDLEALKKMQIVDMYKPVLQKECVFVDGGSPQEKGKNLAELLVEDDVISKRI